MWKKKGNNEMPRWLDPNVWGDLVQYWLDQKLDDQSSNSRAQLHDLDGTGPYKHRSGQTSYRVRARKIVSI